MSIAPTSTNTTSVFHAVSFPRTSDTAAQVVIAGELDICGVPHMDRALRRAERDGGPVVVDMQELEFLDSSGLQLLLATDLRLRSAGRHLILRGLQPDVRWCLELTGADRRLELD